MEQEAQGQSDVKWLNHHGFEQRDEHWSGHGLRWEKKGPLWRVTAKCGSATGSTPEIALGELLRVTSTQIADLVQTQSAIANVLTVDPWKFW